MSARCKGCDAEIMWAVTLTGKRMPLDVKPQKRVVLIEQDHPHYLGRFGESQLAELVDTFMPHHATCPAVDQFRKKVTA